VAPAALAPRDIPRWHDAAVREWIGNRRGPFFIASALPTKLDDVATRSVRLDSGAAAELAHAVSEALAKGGTVASGSRGAAGSTEADRLASDIAAALAAADRPLIVAGTASGDRALLDAAAAVAAACGARARIALTAPECNSLGITLLGGQTLETAFAAIERGEVETLIVVENDLYRRAPRARVDQALAKVPHLVVLDHTASPTLRRAELVLPAATFAEGDGTLVSSEGRAQRFFQVCPPRPGIGESWRWLGEGAARAGLRAAGPWPDLAAVASALALEHRALARAGESAAAEEEPPGERPIPRQPHRWSGRTAILADRTVHEPAPPADPDSPFVFSMEGQPVTLAPGRLLPFYWWPRWNSVQSLNKFLSRDRATAITREPAAADSREKPAPVRD
jgi:NADH-quinone oxidoreductase subunit G